MKTILSFLLLGVCTAIAFFAMKPVRVKNYLLSSSIKTGSWITIEYGNPKCPALREGHLSRDIPIPADGYLCTSSPIINNWAFYRYYLVDENGRRSRLRVGKEIFLERTLLPDPLNPNCRVLDVESFWFGHNDQPNGDEFAAIKKAHPECDKGVTISP